MSGAIGEDELIRRASVGDGDALESLLLCYCDRLVADISRRIPSDIRGALSAEDVVQDAFIVAFQRIGEFQPAGGAGFYAWLARIAQNRLMDAGKALRAAKRGGGWARIGNSPAGDGDELVSLLEMVATHSRTPSRSAAADEAAAAVTAALDALDSDYGQVLRLRYLEMQPVEACAARLGRSEGAIHMLLSRALAALRQRMGDTDNFFTRKL